MYLAYSAFQDPLQKSSADEKPADNNYDNRYNAYQAICNKYTREIKAIRKYFPGWMPAYPNQ